MVNLGPLQCDFKKSSRIKIIVTQFDLFILMLQTKEFTFLGVLNHIFIDTKLFLCKKCLPIFGGHLGHKRSLEVIRRSNNGFVAATVFPGFLAFV